MMSYFENRCVVYFSVLAIAIVVLGCQKGGPLKGEFPKTLASFGDDGSMGDDGSDDSDESGPAGSTETPAVDEPVSTAEPTGPQWKAFHLRSQAQKKAGVKGGEGMQMVQMAEFSLSNPSYVYFVVDTSQVWRSIDGGVNWEPKSNDFRAVGGVSLVIDPSNEKVVFVSGAYPDGGSPVDGIYRTLNGGDSWQLVKQTFYEKGDTDREDPGEGQHYAFDPDSFDGHRHQTIYASTHKEGLFKSIDGGDTWKYLGLSGIKVLDIALHRNGAQVILYVATNQYVDASKTGFYKVIDDGQGVSISNLGDLPNYPRTIALVPKVTVDQNIIYATCGTRGTTPSSVYKSTDGGHHFISINPDANYKGEYRTITVSQADTNYLYVKPDNGTDRPFAPFFSHDGGATWDTPDSISNGDEIHPYPYNSRGMQVAPHPTERNIAISFFDGNSPRMTKDGGYTWGYSGHGYSGGRRVGGSSSFFDPNDPNKIMYFLFDFGTLLSLDGGESFKRLTPGTKGLAKSAVVGAVHPKNPDVMLVAGENWAYQILQRSVDGGVTWNQVKDTDENVIDGDFSFLKFHPQDHSYVYVGSKTDSWISSNGGVTFRKVVGKSIMALFPGDGDVIYAVSGKDIYRSKDKGVSFTKITTLSTATLRGIEVDPTDSNKFFVADANDLYVWDGSVLIGIGLKGGITKENFGSLSNAWISTFLVDPVNANNIYVGTRAGPYGHRTDYIFRSIDGGKSFQSIRHNLLPNSSVWALAIHPHNGDLHMCTAHGNFILKNPSAP